MSHLLRPAIRALAGYTPGEQPRDNVYIKLNTNENPYPPSPRVFEVLHQAPTGDRLRNYPDSVGTHFPQVAGQVLAVDPDSMLVLSHPSPRLRRTLRASVPSTAVRRTGAVNAKAWTTA